jgi:4-hydroxyphenylpyruvate dioxygenase
MFLEHNKGPGVQHIALKTNNIFETLRKMQNKSVEGGTEFMPKPNKLYYERLPARIGDVLTAEQYKECEELGILVDKDDQGTLLQIFTKPLQDRPTLFIEIIQRVGCMQPDGDQLAGCGGFGKGNFTELFKSIEDYEKILSGDAKQEKAQMPC